MHALAIVYTRLVLAEPVVLDRLEERIEIEKILKMHQVPPDLIYDVLVITSSKFHLKMWVL